MPKQKPLIELLKDGEAFAIGWLENIRNARKELEGAGASSAPRKGLSEDVKAQARAKHTQRIIKKSLNQ